MEEEPDNTKLTGRNPDGTWKKGFCPNPGGRSKKPIKEYGLKKFNEMTDEQKEEFLESIPAGERWRMIEGNPKQDTDITSAGEKIFVIPSEIIRKNKLDELDEEDEKHNSDTSPKTDSPGQS